MAAPARRLALVGLLLSMARQAAPPGMLLPSAAARRFVGRPWAGRGGRPATSPVARPAADSNSEEAAKAAAKAPAAQPASPPGEAAGQPAAGGGTSAAAATVSRSQLTRDLTNGGVAVAYAWLLYQIGTAPDNPTYLSKLKSTVGVTVPAGGMRVLEVGIGSADHLEFYPQGTRLVGLDARLPPPEARLGTQARARELGIKLTWKSGDAQKLPFKDSSFDAVVMNKVLCSVEDVPAAVREVSRVLVPGGRFGYLEHVRADQGSFLEFNQLAIDPLQQAIAGNCHLHRATDVFIRNNVGPEEGKLFSRVESEERYEVWQMWPIAQQAVGVATK